MYCYKALVSYENLRAFKFNSWPQGQDEVARASSHTLSNFMIFSGSRIATLNYLQYHTSRIARVNGNSCSPWYLPVSIDFRRTWKAPSIWTDTHSTL